MMENGESWLTRYPSVEGPSGDRKARTSDVSPGTESLPAGALYEDQESLWVLFPLLKRRQNTHKLIKRCALHRHTHVPVYRRPGQGQTTFAPPPCI